MDLGSCKIGEFCKSVVSTFFALKTWPEGVRRSSWVFLNPWALFSPNFSIIRQEKFRKCCGKSEEKYRRMEENWCFWHPWQSKYHSANGFRSFLGGETMRNRLISTKMKIAPSISKKFFNKILERFSSKIVDFCIIFLDDFIFPRAFRKISSEKWGRAIWKMGAGAPQLLRTLKNIVVA